MNSFEELKLDSDLLKRLEELGYSQPTAFQKEAIPAIARGTNGVGVASAGCGKTLAYGLGLAGRLDIGDPDPQVLVLRPTDDRAAATADALHRLLAVRGLETVVLGTGSQHGAQLAVASPAAGLSALQRSTIKLSSIRSLVVDGASAMVDLGDGEALETLTAQIPKDAQRVLLTSRLTAEVEEWIDRHARRARQFTYAPAEPKLLAGADIQYCAAPKGLWLPALMGVLSELPRGGAPIVSIHCLRPSEATELRNRLRVRGISFASAPEEPGIWIEYGFPGPSPRGAFSVSWGVPPDYVSFHARAADSERALILLQPAELPHLQRLAESAAVPLTALRSSAPPEAAHSVRQTREELREAAVKRDLEPYMLLLEPLLEVFTPTQVAAAAIALLRDRAPIAPEEQLPAWTRLYFNVGRRDNVRPADLVGAITGETSVAGDAIGRIEIRDNYTSVEVAATVADKVIKGLASATIRGRPANVRVFRE